MRWLGLTVTTAATIALDGHHQWSLQADSSSASCVSSRRTELIAASNAGAWSTMFTPRQSAARSTRPVRDPVAWVRVHSFSPSVWNVALCFLATIGRRSCRRQGSTNLHRFHHARARREVALEKWRGQRKTRTWRVVGFCGEVREMSLESRRVVVLSSRRAINILAQSPTKLTNRRQVTATTCSKMAASAVNTEVWPE